MAGFRTGRVLAQLEEHKDLVRYSVSTDRGEIVATGFPSMLGPADPGDRVVVNTTGIDLGLGTGGEGFIVWNLDGSGPEDPGEGHIVKLRYTPWQKNVAAVEAPESPHHDALALVETRVGMPVVVCGLHSQIAGVAAGIKAAAPWAQVGYLMTDGGALPLQWSRLVNELRNHGLIGATATCGHAFGGDFESVNAYTGLTALKTVGACHVVVVAAGPGVTGTATALGFSGMETGPLLDAAGALEGSPVACLRISFADERARHHGVSHHSLTALRLGARERCTVAVPELAPEQQELVERRLEAAGIAEAHDVATADGAPGVELLRREGIEVSSMGRSLDADTELWLAAAAAGSVAAALL